MNTIEALMGGITMLRLLRDNQDTVSCPDDGGCICDKFDVAIDGHVAVVIEIAYARLRHIEQVDLPEMGPDDRVVWQQLQRKSLLAEQIRLYDILHEFGEINLFKPDVDLKAKRAAEEAEVSQLIRVSLTSTHDDDLDGDEYAMTYGPAYLEPIKCRRGTVKF